MYVKIITRFYKRFNNYNSIASYNKRAFAIDDHLLSSTLNGANFYSWTSKLDAIMVLIILYFTEYLAFSSFPWMVLECLAVN